MLCNSASFCPTLALPREQTILRRHVFAARFDPKQLLDQSNGSADKMIATTLRFRQAFFCRDSVATRVRLAAQLHQLIGVGDIVVQLIAVSLQCRAGLDARLERRGVCRAARRSVTEQPNGKTSAAHPRATSPGKSYPEALAEPYVAPSRYTVPVIQAIYAAPRGRIFPSPPSKTT